MKYQILLASFILFLSCSSSKNHVGWTETTVPDQYGNLEGYKALEVKGYDLSRNLKEAIIQYYVTEDMISGGYKPVFIFTLDGATSSDSLFVTTPAEEEHGFECYDGLIFNIDIDSDNIQRLIPLFENEKLTITQGNKIFTINCSGFYEL